MYNYNCSECNEAKLQSDKNARKINEVIDRVNALIQVNNETVDFLEEKANEVVEEIAEIKVNEVLGDLTTEIDIINASLPNYNNITLFSHRGSSDCPENTLFAIKQALRNGFKGIEIDTRQCGSGEFVLVHDATVDRTSNGSGDVSALSLTELKNFDFGANKNKYFTGIKIPTLEEALIECNKFDIILLEIKGWNSSEDIKKIAELIVNLNLENKVYCMGYNYDSWKYRIREVSDKIKCVAIAGTQESFNNAIEMVKMDINSTISFDKNLGNISNLNLCRKVGIEPILYTFDKTFEIKEKMKIGYKYFTTNTLGGVCK